MHMDRKTIVRTIAVMGIITMLGGLFGCSGNVGGKKNTLSGTWGAEGDGSNITWSVDKQTKTLKIEGTGAMADGHAPWHSYDNNISKYISNVEISEGITKIGDDAFYGMSNLTCDISIPSTVTVIGDFAFYGCSNLTGTIKFPEGLERIGDYAFEMCEKLTGTLEFPDKLTYIGMEAFSKCHGLNGELKFPQGITEIKNSTFYECAGLTGSVKIPEGVTNIGNYAFAGCTSLAGTLELPSTLKTIGMNAFMDCKFTGDLIVPENVTGIGPYAFFKCAFGGALELPDGLTEIYYDTFYSVPFESVKLPKNLVMIGTNAFENCNIKGELILPESLRFIGDAAFLENSGITKVKLPENLEFLGELAFYRLDKIGSEVVIPASTLYVGREAFGGEKEKELVYEGTDITSLEYPVRKVDGSFWKDYDPEAIEEAGTSGGSSGENCEPRETAVPTYEEYHGYGIFSDTVIKLLPDHIEISRMHNGEMEQIARVRVEIDDGNFLVELPEPFVYKDHIFEYFRYSYGYDGASVLAAGVKNEDTEEFKVFADWSVRYPESGWITQNMSEIFRSEWERTE